MSKSDQKRAFVPSVNRHRNRVNLIHQDLKAPLHNLVDFLRVEPFRNDSEVGHISKEHGHQLPLPLDRAPGGEDLICQMLRGANKNAEPQGIFVQTRVNP
jgi:hypothetical protein